MYTFPQIIANENGNSYISTASYYLSHNDLQMKLKELLKTKATNNNKYFVYEIKGTQAVLIAAQPNSDKAIYYFNNGDNSKRIIVHFNEHFLLTPKY